MSIQETFQAAVRSHDWETAEAALRDGANLEHVSGFGKLTPFLEAVDSEDITAAIWLYRQGANVNAVSGAGDTALMSLIQRNGWATFKSAITSEIPFDLSSPNAYGVTPLLRAALFAHGTPYVQELLKRGVDPSVRSLENNNALMVAVSENRFDMAKILFDAGADPLAINRLGQNLIFCAVNANSSKMMQLVLDRTKDVRAQGLLDVNHSSHGNSKPIARAAKMSQLTSVVLLMRAGADLNARDSDLFGPGIPALSLLALKDDNGDASLVKEALALGANPRLRDYQGHNALFWAVADGLDGKREVLQALIDAGLEPSSASGPEGVSPIHMVFKYQQPLDHEGQPQGPSQREVIRMLMDMGFPTFPERWKDPGLNEVPQQLPPPLMIALSSKRLELAQELLDGGTPLNVLNSDGKSVLHFMGNVKGYSLAEEDFMAKTRTVVAVVTRSEKAAEEKKAQEAKGVLAQSGVPSSSKMSPKQKAQFDQMQEKLQEMEREGLAVVAQASQWLSDNGANWNLKGRLGVTPLMDIAEDNGTLMLGQLVRFHGASLTDVDDEGFGVVDYAWKGKADETLLAILGHCQQVGDLKPVEAILFNAVLSSPDLNPDDRATYAERSHFLQRLRLLPAIPELLEYRDSEGNTPLIVAAATGQDDVMQVLMALGANVNAQNHAGETAVMHAIAQGQPDAVRALRFKGADLTLKNAQGVSAAQFAASSRDARIKYAAETETLIEVEALPELPEAFVEAAQRATTAWDRLAPLASNAPAPRRRLFG